jgi:hypothetical protein
MRNVHDDPELELQDAASEPERVLIYRTPNAIEAKSLAMYLEDEGIEAHVTGETLYEAYAGLGLSRTSPVDVWIAAADRDEALPLVNAWRAEHPEPAEGLPPKFRYSVRSLLVLTTVIAVFAFVLARNGETGAAIIALLCEVLLYLVPSVIYFYRRYVQRKPQA